MTAWQPISTLPESGTVLVYFPASGCIDLAMCFNFNAFLLTATIRNGGPSHWMPLPAPPAKEVSA